MEKIYLHNTKAVRLLTIYASVYQNESETKSANTCWGILTRFANGTSAIANTPCYGYRRNEVGELEVVPKEAEVMLLIYAFHNKGLSLRKIAGELKERNILSPKGKPQWGISCIRRILHNEKYIGHVLLQKTYVSDYFTGKQATNNGELPRYLLEDHHESIVKSY